MPTELDAADCCPWEFTTGAHVQVGDEGIDSFHRRWSRCVHVRPHDDVPGVVVATYIPVESPVDRAKRERLTK